MAFFGDDETDPMAGLSESMSKAKLEELEEATAQERQRALQAALDNDRYTSDEDEDEEASDEDEDVESNAEVLDDSEEEEAAERREWMDQDDEDELPQPEPERNPSTGRRRKREPRTTNKAYKDVMATLRKHRMSAADFIKLYIGSRGTDTHDNRLREVIAKLPDDKLFSGADIRDELKGLIHEKYFDEYDPEESMDPNLNLRDIDTIIEEKAPLFTEVVMDWLKNQRAHHKQYKAEFKDLRGMHKKRRATIASIIVHSMAARNSNFMHKSLGVFLVSKGCKVPVLEVLNNMGICNGYRTIQKVMNLNAKAQMEAARKMAQDPQTAWVYDNFNRQQKRTEQRVGDVNEQVNLTTSYIRRSPHIPVGGLKPSMLRLQNKMKLDKFLEYVSNRDTKATTMYHIDQAIDYVFGDEVKEVFSKKRRQPRGQQGQQPEPPKRPEWVDKQRLPTEPTELFSLPPSNHNEVTIEGTYAVLDDIAVNFLKLDPEKDFDDILRIIVGDQLTIERLMSVMGESLEAEKTYDNKAKWIAPVLAWFHIFMNALWTILRTHYDKNKQGQHLDHCIVDDCIEYWGMKGVTNKNPKFYIIQSCVIRMFRARVCALFIQALIDRRLLSAQGQGGGAENENRIDTVKAAVKKLNQDQYLEILEEIHQKAFSPDAWQGNKPSARQQFGPAQFEEASEEADKPDPAFTTMSRFLIEAAQFFTVREAVRMEDVGYLREAAHNLVIPFIGAGQTNYGRHMLKLCSYLDDDIADEPLQHAILATGLVNENGKSGHAVAADEMLEMHNSDYSIDIKHHANSTHDLPATFKRISLNRTASKAVQKAFKAATGIKGSSRHSMKNTQLDVFSRADKLVSEGRAMWQKEPLSGPVGALSMDIQQIGVEGLAATMDYVNNMNNSLASGEMFVTDDATLQGGDDEEDPGAGNRGPITDDDLDDFFQDVEGFHDLDQPVLNLTGEPLPGGRLRA